ncbi:MAG: spermidine/putrescine ABC transporter substrate-binding protein [Candidatus Babeliales bacterium]
MVTSPKMVIAVRLGYFFITVFLIVGILKIATYEYPHDPARSLTVLAWVDTIDSAIIESFEKKMGVKVYVTHFESNEELFVKLFLSNGGQYDIIMPSDYFVSKLIDHKLVKKIDTERLSFFDRLIPQLLDRPYDPHNEYSIPYCWTLYGIGVNKELANVAAHDLTWKDLFVCTESQRGTVAMVNAVREATAITALMRYHDLHQLSEAEVTEVEELLKEQKKCVAAYVDADFRANYLLISQQAAKAVVTSANIARALQQYPHLDFAVPQEGGFLLIDTMMISANCSKEDLAYAFINFLYNPEIVAHHMQTLPVIMATQEAEENMKAMHYSPALIQEHFHPTKPLFLFQDIIPESKLFDLWLAVKTT